MTASTSGYRSLRLDVISEARRAIAARTSASSHNSSALSRTFQASSGAMGRGVYASRPGAASQRFKESLERLPDFRMLAPVCHHRLHVPELRAAIVPGSVESVREHAIFREQRRDRVGELDFAPGAGLELRQVMEYARGQDVPPDHGETGWRRLRFGLLDDSHHALDVPGDGFGLDNTVLAGLLARDLLHREHWGLVPLEYLGHLPKDRRVPVDKVVGEDHGKDLVVHRGLCAQHRVSQAERLWLPDVDAVHRLGNDAPDELEQIALSTRSELRLDLVGLVEMVLDGALVAPGDEHHVVDPCRDGFLDRVLNERFVDDRHHLLRARLGGRKEAAAHAGHGENGLCYSSHCLTLISSLLQRGDKMFFRHDGQRHTFTPRCNRLLNFSAKCGVNPISTSDQPNHKKVEVLRYSTKNLPASRLNFLFTMGAATVEKLTCKTKRVSRNHYTWYRAIQGQSAC